MRPDVADLMRRRRPYLFIYLSKQNEVLQKQHLDSESATGLQCLIRYSYENMIMFVKTIDQSACTNMLEDNDSDNNSYNAIIYINSVMR